MTSVNGEPSLVKRGSDLIWEAASLYPGTPGHTTRTALLVSRMRALFREATDEIERLSAEQARDAGPVNRYCLTHDRAHEDDGDRTCRWATPEQERVLTKYDPPEPEAPHA